MVNNTPKSPISCYTIIKWIGYGFVLVCVIFVWMYQNVGPGRSGTFYICVAVAAVIVLVFEVLAIYRTGPTIKDDETNDD
jgi:uncharacterized membrane protein